MYSNKKIEILNNYVDIFNQICYNLENAGGVLNEKY